MAISEFDTCDEIGRTLFGIVTEKAILNLIPLDSVFVFPEELFFFA